MRNQIAISLFLFVGLNGFGQESSYCLHFTKEKKEYFVKEGRNIHYILSNDTVWTKGNLIRITKDSISIEHDKESNIFAEGENTFMLTYHLNDIKAIAYKKPETVVRGTAISTASTLIIIASLGALAEGINPENSFKRFNKILDIEAGWKFDVVKCKKN